MIIIIWKGVGEPIDNNYRTNRRETAHKTAP